MAEFFAISLLLLPSTAKYFSQLFLLYRSSYQVNSTVQFCTQRIQYFEALHKYVYLMKMCNRKGYGDLYLMVHNHLF